MSVTMRVLQQYDIRQESQFLSLEREFAALERRRPDFRRGRRFRPLAGAEPSNTLIWEDDFENLEQAREWLAFLEQDSEHCALFARQQPYFQQVRIEFYEKLDY